MSASPRPGINLIEPYVPGATKALGGQKPIKLSSNETPFGPSPNAIEAYLKASGDLHLYPEGSAAELREALADQNGLDADRIVCGCGSDEIFHLLAQAYLNPGDEVIYSEHAFLVYPIVTKAACAVPRVAPEKNLTADIDAMLSLANEKTKIVFLANPNNPTGTYVSSHDVLRLRKELPEETLLVIDAAYAEYVRRNDYDTGIDLVESHDNVIMTRTFSKVYGLAALRLGWAYCPADVADVLNRIRGPFNTSLPAQKAGIEALKDVAFTQKAIDHNDIWLSWLRAELGALGLGTTQSVGNFVLIQFPETPGQTAADANVYLSNNGYVLRDVTNYGLPNALRMTVGLVEQNRGVVDCLRDFLGKANGKG